MASSGRFYRTAAWRPRSNLILFRAIMRRSRRPPGDVLVTFIFHHVGSRSQSGAGTAERRRSTSAEADGLLFRVRPGPKRKRTDGRRRGNLIPAVPRCQFLDYSLPAPAGRRPGPRRTMNVEAARSGWALRAQAPGRRPTTPVEGIAADPGGGVAPRINHRDLRLNGRRSRTAAKLGTVIP